MGILASIMARFPAPPAGRDLVPAGKAGVVEGEYRHGPYAIDEGWIPATWGSLRNWWQAGHRPLPLDETATVEACVSAYAQTIAMLPGAHKRKQESGGVEDITTSALSRILRRPNTYQTISDFLLNLVSATYYAGNGYAVAVRNSRFEIDSLHLLPARQTRPVISPEGEVFYYVGGNEMLDPILAGEELSAPGTNHYLVPARDVMHIRLRTRGGNPFDGISPLVAAGLAQASAVAIGSSQAAFFSNMSRPSGVLQTDKVFTADQLTVLRNAWKAESTNMNAGGVPILSAGLKWESLTMSAVDAQMIEQLKWSTQEIARVMRVPGAIINDMTGSTWNNTETLMNFWIADGLGFLLNHIELAFDNLFQLKQGQYTEFDTDILLRSEFAARIEGLSKAVTNGIMSPNEARAREGLAAVKDGEEPRVQAQNVPLSAAGKIPATTPAAPAAPAAKPANANDPPDPEKDPAKKPATKAEISLRIRTARDARLRRTG